MLVDLGRNSLGGTPRGRKHIFSSTKGAVGIGRQPERLEVVRLQVSGALEQAGRSFVLILYAAIPATEEMSLEQRGTQFQRPFKGFLGLAIAACCPQRQSS